MAERNRVSRGSLLPRPHATPAPEKAQAHRVRLTNRRQTWGGEYRLGETTSHHVKVCILLPRNRDASAFISRAERAATKEGYTATRVTSVGMLSLPAVVICDDPPRDLEERPGRRVVRLTDSLVIEQQANRALLEHLWDRYKSPPEHRSLQPHWPVVPLETALPISMVPSLWDAYERTIRPLRPHQRLRSALIIGRSGTGKEALAKFLCRAWHEARANDPAATMARPQAATDLTEAMHRLAIQYALAALDLASARSRSSQAGSDKNQRKHLDAKAALDVLEAALEQLGGMAERQLADDPRGGHRLESFCRAIVEGEPEAIVSRLKEAGLVSPETRPAKVAGGRQAPSTAQGRHAAISFPELPESMVASYLLGWRKGAFSDARNDHQGPFEEAGVGGSVHLDEVGKTDKKAGATLLRLLSTGLVRPLAADAPIPLAPQFVVATMTLDDEQVLKRTLPDLWNRLSEIRIETESLRNADLEMVRSMALFLGRSVHPGDEVFFTEDCLGALMERCRSPSANVELREFHRIIARAVDTACDRLGESRDFVVEKSDLPAESTNAASTAVDAICESILGATPPESQHRVSEALSELTRPPRVGALREFALDKELAVKVYEAVKKIAGAEIGAALFARTVKTLENWKSAGAAQGGPA